MIAGVTTPAAAVIIPTHNRVELLQKVLNSILAQTVPVEIYVMDDASSDGTEAIIRSKYPTVFFHREEIGKGPTFQRNKAAARTRAPILVTIDDDCVLVSPKTLEQTLEAFDHPRVAGVTLPFINVLANQTVLASAKKDGTVRATLDYFGGMVALRRDVYQGVGGYRTNYFIQVEEPDLSIRMLEAGYVVRHGWADPLHHMESPLRDAPGREVQGPRNMILYLYYNVPWPQLPLRMLMTSTILIYQGIQKGRPGRVLRGLFRGFAGIVDEFGKRAPVPQKIYRLSRQLRNRGTLPMEDFEAILPPMRPFPKD
jgi:glycosyltransferase involved in cell wall biosynthesis